MGGLSLLLMAGSTIDSDGHKPDTAPAAADPSHDDKRGGAGGSTLLQLAEVSSYHFRLHFGCLGLLNQRLQKSTVCY